LEDLRLHKSLFAINCSWSNNRFQFSKTWKLQPFSHFTLIIFWDIEPQWSNFSVWTLHCIGGWGIGWNRTRTNQNDECTGHLFYAHVHYVIGNKNEWFLVSRLLNAFTPFFAPPNSEKASLNCFWLWFLKV